MTRLLATCFCLGAMFASGIEAQTADATMKNFVSAANNLTNRMRAIFDADTAQQFAPDLVDAINTLNPLTAQLKALYGVQANQDAIQKNGQMVTDAQNALQKEQTRLLSSNCSLEGSVKSVGGGQNVVVNFANLTGEDILTYWIDFNGKRTSPGTLKAGQTATTGGPNTYVNHYFLAANSAGVCIGLYPVTGAGTMRYTGLLTPSVGPFLALIAN